MPLRTLTERSTQFAFAFLATSSATFAHPGHDVEIIPSSSPLHMMLHPQHAVSWLLVLAFGLIGVGLLRRIHATSRLKLARITPSRRR